MNTNTPEPSDISELRILDVPFHSSDRGSLGIVEGRKLIPFDIARTFHITNMPVGGVRGRHAHRRCSQFMLCLNGAMSVLCDDGARKSAVRLDRADKALLVPSGIWVELRCEAEQSVFLVLCDRPFEEADYIRDLADFKAWRAGR